MKMSMRGETMKNKRTTRSVSRRVGGAPGPERCVIVIPGHGIEVPVIFKSWIYDGSEEKFDRVS